MGSRRRRQKKLPPKTQGFACNRPPFARAKTRIHPWPYIALYQRAGRLHRMTISERCTTHIYQLGAQQPRSEAVAINGPTINTRTHTHTGTGKGTGTTRVRACWRRGNGVGGRPT